MELVAPVCPVCRKFLDATEGIEELVCSADKTHCFPIVNNVPILINEDSSVFSISDYLEQEKESGDISGGLWVNNASRSNIGILKEYYRKFARSLVNFHVKTDRLTVKDAIDEVSKTKSDPYVLVIGSGELSYEKLNLKNVVYTDVAVGTVINFVCDAHDLPFPDESFDLVLAVAVLEHVIDPNRVVDEIHRVLKPDGIVFASTPFMQPIHLGAYDFTRFTITGYRRLFRRYESIALEPALGPGSSLAYSIQYFLTSFSSKHRLRSILNLVGLVISRPFKYIDKMVLKRKSALLFAAGYVFIGRKSDETISDREIVKQYTKILDIN